MQPEPPGSPLEASIRRMRRAAVFDIFDQLDLEVVPSNVWPFVDTAPDIAAGLDRFFFTLGIDPAKLKARDRLELGRARELVELLGMVRDAFARLPEAVVDRIAGRLHSGDYDAVRRAARAVATMEAIYRAAAIWPPEDRLCIFAEYLEQVQSGLDDPLSFTDDDIAAAKNTFDTIAEAARRFAAANELHRELSDELAAIWPSDWRTGARAEELSRIVREYDAVADGLRSLRGQSLKDTVDGLEELSILNERLADLFAAASDWTTASSKKGGAGSTKGRSKGSGGSHAGGGKKAGGAGGKAHASAFDSPAARAREFFGFPRGSDPGKDALKKAYHAFMRVNHPDRAVDEADLMKKTKLCQEAGFHMGNLGF